MPNTDPSSTPVGETTFSSDSSVEYELEHPTDGQPIRNVFSQPAIMDPEFDRRESPAKSLKLSNRIPATLLGDVTTV